MKPTFILTADIHIRSDIPTCRTDDYWEAQEKKIAWLKELQAKHNCPILNAGDLLDKFRSSPHLEAWAIQNLPKILTIVGNNHDMPYNNIKYLNRGSLWVLKSSGVIDILDGYDTFKDILLFGSHFNFDKIPEINLPEGNFKKKIAMLHMMVSKDGEIPNSHSGTSLLKKLPQFDLIVTGHNHQSFVCEYQGRVLINPGSMMRMFADQVEESPKVYLWNEDGTYEPASYPYESGVISRAHIIKKEKRTETIESFVAKMKKDSCVEFSYEKNMENFIKKNKLSRSIINKISEAMEVI